MGMRKGIGGTGQQTPRTSGCGPRGVPPGGQSPYGPKGGGGKGGGKKGDSAGSWGDAIAAERDAPQERSGGIAP